MSYSRDDIQKLEPNTQPFLETLATQGQSAAEAFLDSVYIDVNYASENHKDQAKSRFLNFLAEQGYITIMGKRSSHFLMPMRYEISTEGRLYVQI